MLSVLIFLQCGQLVFMTIMQLLAVISTGRVIKRLTPELPIQAAPFMEQSEKSMKGDSHRLVLGVHLSVDLDNLENIIRQ